MNHVISNVDDITPQFVGNVLRHHGMATNIEHVDVTPVGTGQMATSFRASIRYSTHRGRDTTVPGPQSLVIKVAAANAAPASSDAYAKEVHFYSNVSGNLSAPIPRCLYAAISEDHSTFTLVLEDLAPKKQADQLNGCTLAVARGAVIALANCVRSTYNDRALFSRFGFDSPDPAIGGFYQDVYVAAVDEFADRYESRLGTHVLKQFRAIGPLVGAFISQTPAQFGLVHGDYRADNLMIHPTDPTDVSVVDWQTVGVSDPIRDLSYFLGNSITEEDRLAHEKELVTLYTETLKNAGHTLDNVWNRYSVGHLQGPIISVLGSVYSTRTKRGDDMFCAMSKRAAAAMTANDSRERAGALLT